MFILGDLNIDYKNTKSQNYKQLVLFQNTNHLKQHIKSATRNTSKTSTLIDLILSDAQHISGAGTLDSFISDHQPIYIIKKKTREVGTKISFKGRSYQKYDAKKISDILRNKDWSKFYSSERVDDQWDEMQALIREAADELCPIKVHKFKKEKPPYLTADILKLMGDRDYFYKKAKRTGNEDDWNIAKLMRNRVKTTIKEAKASFIKQELVSNQKNPSKFWRIINSVFPTKSAKDKGRIKLCGPDGDLKEELIADYMNDFFINVGTAPMPKTLPSAADLNLNLDIDPEPLKLEHITQARVKSLIKQLKTSKSSGIEDMKTFLVKDALLSLTYQLTWMMNNSIESGTFPKGLKEATVVPIPKNGNLNEVGNYRPISLLPIPGKILEKIVHRQIEFHLEENQILDEHQYGFRKNCSTIQAIAELTNSIHTGFNNGKKTVALFIDFKKAFDCVQHPILMHKLKHFLLVD